MVLDSPARATADQVWSRTRSAVTSARYPRRLSYTIAIEGFDGAAAMTNHYRASCNPQDEAIRVFPISDEELAAAPQVPHGVNFYFTVGLSEGRGAPAVLAIPAGAPVRSADLLGEPILSPTYMFGLDYRSVSKQQTEGPSAMKTIAVVSAASADYRVALIDMPVVDGVAAYHLELQPLRRPKQNRLRELWIRSDDYLPLKAVISGNFTIAPLVDVPWIVDFVVLEGSPYIARESARSTLYLAHRRVVRDATIAFQNIRESEASIYDEPLVTPETNEGTLIEPPA